MKKLLFLLSFLPCLSFAGFTTDKLTVTSSETIRGTLGHKLALITNHSFGPFNYSLIDFYDNIGFGDSLNSSFGWSDTDSSGVSFNGTGIYMSGTPAWAMARVLDSDFVSRRKMRIYNASGTNYVSLRSPDTLSNLDLVLPSSDGNQGMSVITNGHGILSLGFSSAAVTGTQYSIPVLDGNGSLTESGWAVSPSLLGLNNLAFGDNFFVIGHMGLGLGATERFYSNTLNTYAEAGSPDVEYAETYRMDWSTFKPGKYEAWVSSGPEGSRGQWQTQRIPISTGTLQEGTTIYLSTGTILQMTVSTLTFSDTSIQRSARMYRDYWIPAPGTIPSEAFADSIAPIVLTTGTVFDLMTTDFDSATEECRTFNIGVPNDVDTSSSVFLTEYWTSFTQTSGDVVWKWYHNSGKTTGQLIISTTTIQSINIPASTVTSSTGTLVTTNYSIAISSLGWVADSMVDGRVCRSGADASDTMTGDAKLNAVRIRIKLK